MNRKPIFDCVRAMLGRGFTQDEVAELDGAIDEAMAVEEEKAPLNGPAKREPDFDREAFLLSFRNTNAPAITDHDLRLAAVRLNVTKRHIEMLRKVESGGKSFDDKGRPIILFEPHIFYRRTQGRYGSTPFSNRTWDRSLYPGSYDGRWKQMADAAERDTHAAIESASWGLWQIMGFHWNTLGYESVWDFAVSMVESEAGHLDALVRFIEANGLQDELAACEAGNPDSCRAFARAYNGPAYAKNNYHVKMAEALK